MADWERFVKTFECSKRSELEEQINEFLKRLPTFEGIQIQYSAYQIAYEVHYTAMVLYCALWTKH